MSLNYGIIDTFKLLSVVIKNSMFIAIVLGVIILTIIFILDKNKSFFKHMILTLSIFHIVIIVYYYFNSFLSLRFSNPINNIYFYFLSSIIYLIIVTIMFYKKKYYNLNYAFYSISLINLSYSLFITHYMNNETLIVIGNIFPMIKFGNIIYIIYYIFLIYILCISKKKNTLF